MNSKTTARLLLSKVTTDLRLTLITVKTQPLFIASTLNEFTYMAHKSFEVFEHNQEGYLQT